MPGATPILLAAAVTLASATGAAAQVTKPRRPELTERLPAPAKITAAQLPDGRIHVVWSSVEGAASYKLSRSALPAGVIGVSRTNPSDTGYVDSDVKPGNSYYYVVLAVDEAGFGGLNVSTPPMKAASPPVPDAAPPAATSTTAAPPELTTVTLNQTHWYPDVFINWGPHRPSGVWYVVERAQVSSGGQSAWEAIPGFNTRCCNAVDSRVAPFPAGTRLIYRVTAVDSAAPANKSAPVLSSEITTFKIEVRSPVLKAFAIPIALSSSNPEPGLGIGEDKNLHLISRRWVSLNESVATVDNGAVTARALGIAYIVVMGMTADGAVASAVYRIQVIPRP